MAEITKYYLTVYQVRTWAASVYNKHISLLSTCDVTRKQNVSCSSIITAAVFLCSGQRTMTLTWRRRWGSCSLRGLLVSLSLSLAAGGVWLKIPESASSLRPEAPGTARRSPTPTAPSCTEMTMKMTTRKALQVSFGFLVLLSSSYMRGTLHTSAVIVRKGPENNVWQLAVPVSYISNKQMSITSIILQQNHISNLKLLPCKILN